MNYLLFCSFSVPNVRSDALKLVELLNIQINFPLLFPFFHLSLIPTTLSIMCDRPPLPPPISLELIIYLFYTTYLFALLSTGLSQSSSLTKKNRADMGISFMAIKLISMAEFSSPLSLPFQPVTSKCPQSITGLINVLCYSSF